MFPEVVKQKSQLGIKRLRGLKFENKQTNNQYKKKHFRTSDLGQGKILTINISTYEMNAKCKFQAY